MKNKNNINIKKIAKDNFNKWNSLLQIKDSQKVAQLYESNSTFLPTLSTQFKKGKSGANDYFKHFLLKNPSGFIIKDEVQELENGNSYIHSGFYNFKIKQNKIVKARFTYVWKKDKNGKWGIIHHHSSLKPL